MQAVNPAQQPTKNIDVEVAAEFLDLLGGKQTTFQTIDDSKDKDRKLARILHGGLADYADQLCDLNRRGAGVFVSINETDGKGRKRQNITAVRAIFLDLDGAPIDPVLSCKLKPHVVVESSAGRYHVYWLVKDFPLEKFEDVQRAVAKRFDGDPAVALLTACARLPGFLHNKSEPFQTKIIETNNQSSYGVDEILIEFSPKAKSHKPPTSAVVLPAGVPVECAREFVRHGFRQDDALCLHYYSNGFYAFSGTHYKQQDPDAIRAKLYEFLHHALAAKNGAWVPFNPTPAKVTQILDALKAGIRLDHDGTPPFWLPPHQDRATDLIACKNGLLDIKTRTLIPHTPLFFNVNSLPFAYDPDAPEPARWLEFLSELWPEDQEAKHTLQEMFGLMLTPDTSHQKIFMLVGPKRSGKGTIGHVLTELLGGRANVAGATMGNLGTQFGLWPLIDKRVAIIPDARLGSNEANKAIEHLLSVSGEDSLTVDRKYQEHWTGKLTARFLILTNELPRFADAAGALPSRFVVLALQHSFYGKEELDLKEKLRLELPSILNWALDGLDRLRKRGHFEMPKSAQDAIRQMEDLASPVAAFVREECVVGLNRRTEKAKLYGAWKAYCEEQGEKPGSQRIFGRNLLAAFPQVRAGHSGNTKYYTGISLADGEDGEGADGDEGRSRSASNEPQPDDRGAISDGAGGDHGGVGDRGANNAGGGEADKSDAAPPAESSVYSRAKKAIEAMKQRRMRENATKSGAGDDGGTE